MGTEDPVVVCDEHQANLGVQGDVRGGGEVAGHHDGLVVSANGENINFLSKTVNNI